MKRAVLLLLAAGCGTAQPPLEEFVRTLASPSFQGRRIGTEGEKLAATFVASKFRRAGLEPILQEFQAHHLAGRNVIAVAPGASGEGVVIGAHFDHLGTVHPGADDNASGTAVLLELAPRFARKPAGRTIVLVAFSGEEEGLLGSRHYAEHPAVPLEKTVAMINMDMVGRLREKLVVFGADSGDRFRDHLADSPVPIAFNRDTIGPSDHTSFYLRGIPAIHLFTGAHEDYHKPSDTPDKLNYEGMRRIADLVETLARRIADAPERMTYRKVTMEAPPVSAPGGPPYFGSMPDYGFEGKGVRLAGVAPGSPADQAGLREGDIIVEVDGKEVPDVQAYAKILFAHKAGDEISVAYEREGKRNAAAATLTTRRKSEE